MPVSARNLDRSSSPGNVSATAQDPNSPEDGGLGVAHVRASNERRSSPDAGGLSRRSLALVLLASFMVVLDFSIVNVALPSIRQALGFGGDSVQWVVTAYAITFGGLLILGGRMADILGRRRMFEVGLIVFAAASLAAGLAGDAGLLVAARAIQGIGAALVAPAALSLITANHREGPRRTRALGLYGATASLGFVAGQVFGGVLVEYVNWRSIFLVNVPIGIGAVLAARLLFARDQDRSGAVHLDVYGGLLSTLAVGTFVFAVSEGSALGWTHPLVAGALMVTLTATVGFVHVERTHPQPLIDLKILRRQYLATAGSLSFLIGLWSAGELVVLSLYLQQNLHDSPLAAGLVIAPQGVVGFVTGMFGARLVRRIGMRSLLMSATGAVGLGFLVLMHLPASGHYSLALAAVVFVGFGTVGTVFGSTVLAASGMADTDQGLVGGVVNTTRQVGAAIGVVLLVAIAGGGSAHSGVATVIGDQRAMLAAAAIALVGTVVAWFGTRSSQPRNLSTAAVLCSAPERHPGLAVSRIIEVPTTNRRSA